MLEFELANRTYFSASISDRGDAFFEQFATRHRDLLAQQDTGRYAYYVLVDDDGSILGRFNLVDMAGGSAELGYRVAARAAGRGVATAAVLHICELATSEHGLHTLRARTRVDNVASQKVLAKAGFVLGDEVDIVDRPGNWYTRDLARADG